MKTKDIIQLVVAVIILAVAGSLMYGILVPHSSSSSAQKSSSYQKITAINPNFDQSALDALSDQSKNKDFYVAPDLTSGLGNTDPFGSTQ